MKSRIYLDNNATTGVDPLVAKAMYAHLTTTPENPSSIHFFGQEAKKALLKARKTIADYLQIQPQEVLFTSGGTESMNFLIRGCIDPKVKSHIITSNIEHACVDTTLQNLSSNGCDVTFLPADASGVVPLETIRSAIQPHTKLLVFSAVNSETGVKQEIANIAKIAQEHNLLFVVDGVAWLGKEEISIPPGVTGIGFSGHKIHGPKGAGFVFLRTKSKFKPLITGGGQEFGLRSGTENLPGIVGLSKAVSLLSSELPQASTRMKTLRDALENGLKQKGIHFFVNGSGPRIGNTSNLLFPNIDGETLLIQLDLAGIAASLGSACSSGALEPSRILRNMGLSYTQARSSLRFSLSRWTTEEEILQTVDILDKIIQNLRLI